MVLRNFRNLIHRLRCPCLVLSHPCAKARRLRTSIITMGCASTMATTNRRSVSNICGVALTACPQRPPHTRPPCGRGADVARSAWSTSAPPIGSRGSDRGREYSKVRRSGSPRNFAICRAPFSMSDARMSSSWSMRAPSSNDHRYSTAIMAIYRPRSANASN